MCLLFSWNVFCEMLCYSESLFILKGALWHVIVLYQILCFLCCVLWILLCFVLCSGPLYNCIKLVTPVRYIIFNKFACHVFSAYVKIGKLHLFCVSANLFFFPFPSICSDKRFHISNLWTKTYISLFPAP